MSVDSRRAAAFLPLKPVWFHILITLAEEPSHGYAIRQAVETRTAGEIRLWPTTLYGALGQLQAESLIDEVPSEASDDAVPKRTYKLTPLGRKVISAEIERLESLLDLARAATGRVRLS